MNNKLLIPAIVIIGGLILGYIFWGRNVNSLGGEGVSYMNFKTASSTTYSVTTSSVQILATTTDMTRSAVLLQPINCTVSNASLFFKVTNPATVNTGFTVAASSTLALGTYPNTPAPQNTLNAVASAGTCSVLVTEWLQ